MNHAQNTHIASALDNLGTLHRSFGNYKEAQIRVQLVKMKIGSRNVSGISQARKSGKSP
jgi:hypothetical protein